jgi:hypothetical protein
MKLKKENAASRRGAQNTPAHWERLGKKEFIQFAKCRIHNLNGFDFISRQRRCPIKKRSLAKSLFYFSL